MLHSISPSRGLRSAIALVAFAAAAMASAASETFSFDLTPTNLDTMIGKSGATLARSDWWNELANASTNGNAIKMFDATKGTLTSVSITFNYEGYIDGFLTNQSTSTGLLNGSVGHALVIRMGVVGSDYPNAYDSATVYDFSKNVQLDKGETYDYAFDFDGTKTFDYSSASSTFDFANTFIGNGNLTLEAGALGDAFQKLSGPMDSGVNTFASLKGSITYNYTAPASTVPAPPAFAAMGLGALRLARRRRNRA